MIGILDDVEAIGEMLQDVLKVVEYDAYLFQTPSALLEAIKMAFETPLLTSFELVIIGKHRSTKFSWEQTIEQIRINYPQLHVLVFTTQDAGEIQSFITRFTNTLILEGPCSVEELYKQIDTMTHIHEDQQSDIFSQAS
ncbi:MAG: hypothetical protein NVS4B11_16450 [Ktedonobacteraceae bacterium]